MKTDLGGFDFAALVHNQELLLLELLLLLLHASLSVWPVPRGNRGARQSNWEEECVK